MLLPPYSHSDHVTVTVRLDPYIPSHCQVLVFNDAGESPTSEESVGVLAELVVPPPPVPPPAPVPAPAPAPVPAPSSATAAPAPGPIPAPAPAPAPIETHPGAGELLWSVAATEAQHSAHYALTA
jgi:hypothetical protein